jgi:nuclear pore complex protein Nup93
MTGEKDSILSQSASGVVKERHFKEAYLDDAPNSERTITLRKKIVEGSRRFLEKR